jgi:trans-aconitate methyltransferase
MDTKNDSNDLFKGAAQYYSTFRPSIPKQVIEYVAQRYSLDGRGVLLDMGCGTGQSTFALAPLFEKTIAFDVDVEMLEEAKKKAPHDLNIIWQQRSDKDVTRTEGPYRLAVACRSFNWMDQYPLLQRLHSILEIGGGVALIGDGSFWTGSELWQKTVKEVIQGFLGQERRAGQSKYAAPVEPYTMTLSNNRYEDVRYEAIPVVRKWTIDTVLGYLYSTSFSAKHLYGDRLLEFEQVMKEQLTEANNGKSIFIEHTEFIVQSGIHR